MKPHSELIKTKEFWLCKIQNELYALLDDYMEEKGITQTQLAEELGFSKGYISRVLNGNFNHSLEKLIELCLAVGKVPHVKFQTFEEYEAEMKEKFEAYQQSVANE